MGLSDFPHGPACSSRSAGSGSHAPTAGRSRVALCSLVCMPSSLPRRRSGPHNVLPQPGLGLADWQPSPYFRRVGFRIKLFEASMTFMGITACTLGESLKNSLHQRLRQCRYLHWPLRFLPAGTCLLAGRESHPL